MNPANVKVKSLIYGAICLGALALLFIGQAIAMPPHPDLVEAAKVSGSYTYIDNEDHISMMAQGVDAPSVINSPERIMASGSLKLLTVLISFSDHIDSVNAEFFDTLMYGTVEGTVNHYYTDVSYGNLNIVSVQLPSEVGWNTAPQTYAYYVDGQRGLGSYPQNCQKLCEDIANVIDPLVDFSEYDNDGDGYVDGLILVHAGTGYEFSGNVNDIHSHKWGCSSPQYHDGVYVYEYSIQPEFWITPGDMTCGVFCHELGHVLGLPDLYDTDYTSRGTGIWSLMSAGSWLGPSMMGSRPAELDAWSRIELNFKSATNITTNSSGVSIPAIENDGPIYRLWSSGAIGSEYFLVENRQNIGYGQDLPGSGLLIWHIDETAMSGYTINDDEWYPGHTSSGNYAVALEQADNLYQLEQNVNSGNGGDPYPGSASNTSFASLSSPNSNAYSGDDTYVGITNISSSQAIMTADFQVSFLSDVNDDPSQVFPDKFSLEQNYPNPFNPSTNIKFTVPTSGEITIDVYNILGEKVKQLVDDYFVAGTYVVRWNGKDRYGHDVPSGMYLYEIVTEEGTDSKKMTLLK